jgi:Zn-dependent protease with chaperone function
MQVDRRFRSLVERLTREAAERPDAYRRRVILAATLGYLFITLVFMMLLAVIASAIAGLVYARAGAALELKIAFVCALIAYALLRSMFIPHSKPDGIEVSRDRVPALFDMVEGVRRDVNGPAIHAVYITDEMNASLGQPPRFWMFGTRNILSLGLPLMQTLNQDELKSVIAHELGHSLGGHGRWASFVYRVRVRWLQLAERLPTGMVAGLLRRFFKWYGPWFNAYSFVLARTQEFEADRIAARTVSPAVAGSALIRIELAALRFGDYWGKVWAEARTATEPSRMPYAALLERTDSSIETDQRRLVRALNQTSGLDDTHPCLSDRLEALPAPRQLPGPAGEESSASLLGTYEHELIERLDEDWWSASREWWEFCKSNAEDEEEELRKVRRLFDSGDASRKEQERYVELVQSIEGDFPAIEAQQKILARDAEHTSIRIGLGIALLEQQDDTGIGHVERAIDAWPALGPFGYSAIVAYLNGGDDSRRITHYQSLLDEAETLAARLKSESQTLPRDVELAPLQIDPSQREKLVEDLRAVHGLKWIVVGQRSLPLNKTRQIIFVFRCDSGTVAMTVLDQLIEIMTEHGDSLGVEKRHFDNWLSKRLKRLDGAVLLDRS